MIPDFDAGMRLIESSPQLAVLGVLWYVARTKVSKYDEHLENCAHIPKEQLVKTLENLGHWVEKVDGRLVETERQLNVLIGRQIERDKHVDL